jgi:hypothetical protein
MIVESLIKLDMSYALETWVLSRHLANSLLTTEMDFWKGGE